MSLPWRCLFDLDIGQGYSPVSNSTLWPSRLGQENTSTASLQKGKTSPTSILDITLNPLNPVGWDCRIHRLHHCREARLPNECRGYDWKQTDGEAPVMSELWGMPGTPLLPSPPGLLWPRVVAPVRVLSMSQIELNSVLMLNTIVWNRTLYTYKNGFGIR